jgi:uncharacterized membrane protein YcfT
MTAKSVPALAAGMLGGSAAASAGIVLVLDALADRLVLVAAAVLAAAAVVIVLGAGVHRFAGWRRYRHNTVVRAVTRRELLATVGEVPDGRR